MSEQTGDIQQARLAALYEVSAKLGTTLDLGELLNLVMDSIIQLTGAERGFLMLIDEMTGELKTMAARNVDQTTLDGNAMKISRTVVERAVSTGEGILTDNAQEDERFSGHQSVIGYQLRSIMCAPLRARGRVIGAVYVDNRLFTAVFNKGDIELLNAFTNQAAVAIDNARLFTQTDQALARRVEELTLFQRIDQELNKSLNLDRVLTLALGWAVRLTDADSGSIGLIELDEQEEPMLRLLTREGIEENEDDNKEVETGQLIPADHPVLAQVLETEESVELREVSTDQAIDGLPSAAQLAVPVKSEGQVTGLITLVSQHVNNFSQEDIAFVERLSDRAAVAIENSRLYEAVRAANKAKSDFISIVTHELRIPMTSIKGYTDLLMGGMVGELNDQQGNFLEIIKRNLQRMSILISDLADINYIESGRMKFEFEQFDIHEAVQDVVNSLKDSIEARDQSLTVTLPEELPPVYADRNRVCQVLTNLMSNANKYTPDGGDITLEVEQQDSQIRLDVIDNGLGISEKDQAKLFTQFFRSDSEQVRQQTGWGLGLSIVKKMVEAQGGEIDCESTLDEGSTFTFTVPIAGSEAAEDEGEKTGDE